MAEVTQADREKAAEVVPGHRGLCDFDWHTGPNGPGCSCGADRERAAIAAALAAEREKARVPFLALAQELATVACDHHATVAGDAYADAADRIVAVLDGTYL